MNKFTSIVLASLSQSAINALAEKELHRRFQSKARNANSPQQAGEAIAHAAQTYMEPVKAQEFARKILDEHNIDARHPIHRRSVPNTFKDYMDCSRAARKSESSKPRY